jgi:hypothetical protein
MDFSDLLVEKDQQDLLADLVEADRRVEDGYCQFVLVGVESGDTVIHPKMQNRVVSAGDVRTLAELGLIRLVASSGTSPNYEVTPLGRRYYAWMKQQQGGPMEAVEVEVRRLMDSETFRRKYPAAYEQWAEAERALWGADNSAERTAIGHACRESLEHFVTDLVTRYKPEGVNPDPQRTINRVRSVVKVAEDSDIVSALLIAYFGTVWDLVQRQEHGAQKEGKPLTADDARRCVFQTALVMFELDASVG